MAPCILKEFIEQIQKIVITEGDSIARVQKIAKIFGDENAANEINKIYENTLLLKNQKTAIDKFIDSINGVTAEKKVKLKEQIKARLANRTEKIYNDDLLSISRDIFEKKYNIDIKPEDVLILNKLKKETMSLEKAIEGTPSNSAARKAYAEKFVTLSEVAEALVNPEGNLGFVATIKDILKKTGQRFDGLSSIEKVLEGGRLTVDLATSAIYKSIQASMDVSFALRQGFKILATSPKAWNTNLVEAFKPFTKILTPKEKWQVLHDFKVGLVSRELSKEALDAKLAIGVVEEFFPTTLAEKIPVLGRIFKASNEAFTIFSQGVRMSLFEEMTQNALSKGTPITKVFSKELAVLANSITGRGKMGEFEKIPGIVNKLFYSGRFIKSQLDTFALPFNSKMSPEARQIAMQSSLKTLGMFAGLMATASLFTEVETDPRSSKFGKMKIPGSEDTWVDISGGLGSYITLAARGATLSSKSSITGKVKKLNTGEFGSQTYGDVITQFFTNKLAPAPGALLDIAEGRTFTGEKPTISNTVGNLVTPISAGNMIELFQNEETGPAFVATMFDLLGAGQTDYTKFR